MRGINKYEIILTILREGSRTPIELRDEAIKRGVSRSTFYKHIEKLVNSGEVKEAKYELIPKIEEANREEVDNCLSTLIEEDNEHVIFSRLDQLTKLSYSKRIAHFSNVIPNLASLLDKLEIVDNERNLDKFFECLRSILFFEQIHKANKWQRIMERLITATIKKATVLLLRCSNNRIIAYLGMTHRESAVDVIFALMQQHNIEANEGAFSIITTELGTDKISTEPKNIINEKLDNFLRSNDERLITLATITSRKDNLTMYYPHCC